MNDSISSWMIAGGPRTDEHDQRISHLVAIQEMHRLRKVEQPGLVERLRARFAGTTSTECLDSCVA